MRTSSEPVVSKAKCKLQPLGASETAKGNKRRREHTQERQAARQSVPPKSSDSMPPPPVPKKQLPAKARPRQPPFKSPPQHLPADFVARLPLRDAMQFSKALDNPDNRIGDPNEDPDAQYHCTRSIVAAQLCDFKGG